jgi:hypothetical protein
MSKKTSQPDDSDTLPPAPAPPPAAAPDESIVVDDSDGGMLALREFGVTATRDLSPGVVVTLDKVHRVFAGDRIVRRAPGQFEIVKAANA